MTRVVHEHVANNQPFRVNYRIFHADGGIRWLQEWGRAVYNDKGEAVSLIGTIFDATELKSTEEALQRARAEAESANRAKSEFLATMSHEIRTPMNAIINMVRLSLETDLSIRQRQYLDIVEASSRNLLILLNDILDFSKIEANKLNIEEVTFSLFELIEEIANTFRDRVMESSLEFVLQVDPWLPDLVRGDPLRLRQILINLLSNAFKFTEEGEVSLIVESAFPSSDGVGLRFAVRDTGIGIAGDKLKSLFDAFTQADSSTTRQFGGTGLGLAISHRLVSLMGDDSLRVQSELGKGSEFSFCLTLQPDPQEHSTFWDLSQELIGLRVVLVEPHDEQRQIIQSWFQRVGIECSAQPSIPAAVELLREWMFQPGRAIADVLVVDVGRTYRKSDIDLLREYWFPTLPILLFGSSLEAERAIMRSKDRILYQQQPVTPTSLFMALQSACFGQVDGNSLQDSFSLRWSGQFEGCSVLLVEDNHANQFVAREMLSQSGFEVVVVENGMEAVQKVRERTFGAVLMDMQMPEMDGLEATQHIRQEWPKRTLPIIAMTANAMQGDAQRCLAAGMDDYIAKPVHREHLLKKLHRWLFTPREMSSYLSPYEVDSPPAAFELSPAPLPTEPKLATPPEGTRLTKLRGIDVEEALSRLGLPLELFVQLWEGFVEEQEKQIRELEQAVEQQQFEQASHVAHSLAGASANLAAPALQSAARALELAARGPKPELHTLLQRVKQQASIVQKDVALLTLMLPDPNDGF